MLHKSIVLLFSVVQTRVSLRVSGGHAKRSPPAPPGRSRCARAFAGACSARVNARGRWRRPAVTACEATTLSAGTATVAPLLGSFRSRLPPAEPPRASPSRGAVRGLAGRGQRGPPGCRCPPARCPRVCARAGQWPLQPSSRIPAWGVYRPPALSPAARRLPVSGRRPLPARRLHGAFRPVFLCDASLRVLCPFRAVVCNSGV